MHIHFDYPVFKARAPVGTEVFYCETPGSFMMRYMAGGITYQCDVEAKPLGFLTDFTLATPALQFGEA